MLGGVPAFLERLSDQHTMSVDLRQHFFRQVGMFRSESMVLINGPGERHPYMRIGAAGHCDRQPYPGRDRWQYGSQLRRFAALPDATARPGPDRTPRARYHPPGQRRTTTRSRYHVRDPYLRFYFRFIEPNLSLIEQELTTVLSDRINEILLANSWRPTGDGDRGYRPASVGGIG
jgi:hypothetical protein